MSLLFAALVGLSFDSALRHTRYDPTHCDEWFAQTLNGPQTPGVIVKLARYELIIFETCTAHLCAAQHSVVAIDIRTGREYVASYRDNGVHHIINAPFGPAIDKACQDSSCDTPDQMGAE